MKRAHGYRPIQKKDELIDHLVAEHSDTVFGGRASLELESVTYLTESHRYGHFGPTNPDRPLPILQDLMDEVLRG